MHSHFRWPACGPLGYIREMKINRTFLPFFLFFALALSSAFAQTKLELQPSDTLQTVLEKQIGQTVELRMKSGEKIGGKLEKISDKLVLLSALTGADYFDGVVVIDHIAAVVVRAKK